MPHRLAFLAAVLALAVLPAGAQARGGATVQMYDNCDAATFNAMFGPGTCVGDGDVTLAAFFAKANPVDGGHPDWFFSPGTLSLRPGERLRARNRGGETHSFTEVVAFGTGVIEPLNGALPPGTPPAVPVGNPDPSFVPAGGRLEVKGLSGGTHFFECLIHPWMRTTVSVGARHEDD